jgi:transcriptional regulator with XRE-family HTH domain
LLLDGTLDSVVNERLRRAMMRAGLDVESLSEAAQVSAKSVERWLSGRSLPYPRTRFRVARLLREEENYLWPDATDRHALAGAELLTAYPRRSDVPRNTWTDLLRQAERSVDVLAFAGLFLTEEHPEWLHNLREKARSGVRIRLLLGDPNGRQLAYRDDEHQIGGGVTGRVHAVLSHYRQVMDMVQVRLHDTPLYNSIYRFDDEMIVNTHVYGILAAYTPCLHLRRVDGLFFHTYVESFERVWASSRTLVTSEPGADKEYAT